MIRLIALMGVLACASVAPAQIIYEPLHYQYGTQWKYYYGGSDPAVFRFADRLECLATINRSRFNTDLPMQIYSDCIPWQNAAVYNYTVTDARNEAYQNAPRYFRKADLLATAQRTPDGSWVVPAHGLSPSGTITVTPSAASPATTTPAPTAAPQPILIIPKDQLHRPLRTPAPLLLAAK